MKIRTKITLLISVLILISLLLFLSQYFLEKGRMQLFLEGIKKEQQDSFDRLTSLSGSGLAMFATDYTYWDEMVNFVHHPDSTFAEVNAGGSLKIFNANEVFIYNKNKKLVYEQDQDQNHTAIPLDFSEDTWKQFLKNRLTHFFAEKNGVLTEFRVATIHPSDDSERKTEPEGLFIVDKKWDSDYISTLEELSGTTIISSKDELPNSDVVNISFPYEIKGLNDETVETFTVIAPFPILSSVQQTSTRQIWIIVSSSFLILLLVYVFLHIFVGQPIEALSRGIKKKDIDSMKKMQTSSSEFGTLAKLVLDFSEHEQVLEAKAKDEAILHAVGSGLIVVDKEKKIILFNTAAEHLFGINAKEALGLPIDKILKMETREEKPLALAEFPLTLALEEKTIISKTVLSIKPDGIKIPLVITAAPVIFNNEIIGAVQDLRDITVEEALERNKRDFISLVSHEFRTPLTSLGWTTEKLESYKDMPSDIMNSTIPYMKSAIDRIRTLVSTIVEVSKIENSSLITTPTDIEISSLVERSIDEFKPIIEKKNLKVTVSKEDNDGGKIRSDERLLQIIVNNLISNAVRYSKDNGEIQIKIQKKEKEFVISITNTGPGIPINEQSQVFTKMFRATNARLLSPDGMGLGLYISKSFLERLGGAISFNSTPDQETTFVIQLPFNS